MTVKDLLSPDDDIVQSPGGMNDETKIDTTSRKLRCVKAEQTEPVTFIGCGQDST